MFLKFENISIFSELLSKKNTDTSVFSFSLKSFSIIFLQVSRHSFVFSPNLLILNELRYSFNDFDSIRNSL